MSASPMARQVTGSEAIPIKKVIINDSSELPSFYSSTPGGTLFSTTPGGTKIVYEKNILLNLRNSPISNTPPEFQIPSVLQPGTDRYGGIPKTKKKPSANLVPNARQKGAPPKRNQKNQHKVSDTLEDQFEIEL